MYTGVPLGHRPSFEFPMLRQLICLRKLDNVFSGFAPLFAKLQIISCGLDVGGTPAIVGVVKVGLFLCLNGYAGMINTRYVRDAVNHVRIVSPNRTG